MPKLEPLERGSVTKIFMAACERYPNRSDVNFREVWREVRKSIPDYEKHKVYSMVKMIFDKRAKGIRSPMGAMNGAVSKAVSPAKTEPYIPASAETSTSQTANHTHSSTKSSLIELAGLPADSVASLLTQAHLKMVEGQAAFAEADRLIAEATRRSAALAPLENALSTALEQYRSNKK